MCRVRRPPRMTDHDSTDRLLVAIRDRSAVVRVFGRGTYAVSTALKDFLNGAAASGATRAVVDLAPCEGMDSTFLGVLAGTAIRLRPAGGSVALLNLTARTRHLVETLGLDVLVECHDAGATPPMLQALLADADDLGRLASGPTPRANETILEAHETLVAALPANESRFKDVLLFLREDLKRRGGS